MIGDIADGAAGVVMFFGLAFLVTWALVYVFTRSQRLTLLALLCSVIAVIWDLGLLRLLGFGIDPMSILVPFLVFAIGVSHGVQMVNGVSSEIQQGAEASGGCAGRLPPPGGPRRRGPDHGHDRVPDDPAHRDPDDPGAGPDGKSRGAGDHPDEPDPAPDSALVHEASRRATGNEWSGPRKEGSGSGR